MSTQAAEPAQATAQPAPPPIRERGAARVALWPILLVIYATLMPRELRVEVGSLTLFADRIVLIPILPWLVRQLMQGAIRLVLPDFLVLLAGLWMIVAMATHYGIGGGLERGGALALDSVVGYFLARVSFRSIADMRKVLILAAPGIFLAGLTVMLESVLRQPIVQPLAEQLFGRLPHYIGGNEAGFAREASSTRLGLLRGKGPFPHSILAALYLATLVGLYNLSGLRGWPRLLGNLAGFFSLFALSATGVLALALAYFLLFYEWLQRHVRELSWRLLVIGSAALALVLELVSNSGVAGLIGRYLTFDPQTSYFRLLIWRYASQSVEQNPWFGIGFAGYERPAWMVTESIDAHWLLLAVRFGLPVALAMLGAVLIALFAIGKASTSASPGDRRFYRGMAISLAVMTISLFSVAIWANLQALFNILLGGCVACAQHGWRISRAR